MRLFSDNREANRPMFSQPTGYGGQQYGTYVSADKSQLIDGHINDYETGWSGSASEVYDRYVAAGKDPSSLVARYHR